MPEQPALCSALKDDHSPCGHPALPGEDYCGVHLRIPEEMQNKIVDMALELDVLKAGLQDILRVIQGSKHFSTRVHIVIQESETEIAETLENLKLALSVIAEIETSQGQSARMKTVAGDVGIGIFSNLLTDVAKTDVWNLLKKLAGASPALPGFTPEQLAAGYYFLDFYNLKERKEANIIQEILNYEKSKPFEHTLIDLIWKNDRPRINARDWQGLTRWSQLLVLIHAYIEAYLYDAKMNLVVRSSLKNKTIRLLTNLAENGVGYRASIPATYSDIHNERDKLVPGWRDHITMLDPDSLPRPT